MNKIDGCLFRSKPHFDGAEAVGRGLGRSQTWRTLARENIADPVWSHDGRAIFFHDFVQEGQPIYKLMVADGHMERVAGLRDLRSADVVDYRFARLAPEILRW